MKRPVNSVLPGSWTLKERTPFPSSPSSSAVASLATTLAGFSVLVALALTTLALAPAFCSGLAAATFLVLVALASTTGATDCSATTSVFWTLALPPAFCSVLTGATGVAAGAASTFLDLVILN